MGYKPVTILSSNTKTVVPSLNLPRTNCNPTKLCWQRCYGKQGHMSLPCSLRKQTWVSNYLLGTDISRLIKECKAYSSVRLCGGGDFLEEHVPNVLRLAEECPDTLLWGFSRKPNIVLGLNNKLPNLYMQLTVDYTTPLSIWSDIDCDIAYGPRMQWDDVPEDERIRVVFPYHFSGKVVKGVPHHPKDCQAVWDHSLHCVDCRRCYPEANR